MASAVELVVACGVWKTYSSVKCVCSLWGLVVFEDIVCVASLKWGCVECGGGSDFCEWVGVLCGCGTGSFVLVFICVSVFGGFLYSGLQWVLWSLCG